MDTAKFDKCSVLASVRGAKDCENLAVYGGWGLCWHHLQDGRESELRDSILGKVTADGHQTARACFENADLSGVDLSGHAFEDCRFTHARLDDARLDNCLFSRCQMDHCSFVSAWLSGARFRDCSLCDAEFCDASMIRSSFNRCDLTNAWFSRANWEHGVASESLLNHSIITHAILDGTDFRRSKLSSARFDHSSAPRANFSGANLTEASLIGVKLEGAVFGHAVLNKCVLAGSNCRNASFKGSHLADCHMEETELEGAIFDANVLSRVHLRAANVSGLDLLALGLDGVETALINGQRIVTRWTPIPEHIGAFARLRYRFVLSALLNRKRRFDAGRPNPIIPSLAAAFALFVATRWYSPVLASCAFFLGFFLCYFTVFTRVQLPLPDSPAKLYQLLYAQQLFGQQFTPTECSYERSLEKVTD